MTEDDSSAHRELRELLGAYALGDLPPDLRVRLRAHLDGCRSCRSELADIAPAADALRLVDPAALSEARVLPAEVGERLFARIAEERGLVQARARREQRQADVRRRSRQLLAGAAAAVLLGGALTAGAAVGRATAPEVTATPPKAVLPVEDIALRPLDTAVTIRSAVVVAHTWGVEARFSAGGLDAGALYRAAFRADDGRLVPAGEFVGTGDEPLTCNMQSSLLRDDAAAFVVMDEDGRPVLEAAL